MNEVHRLENMDLREEFSENLKFAQLTKAAVKESQRWIEFIAGDKFKHHDNFIKSLQDGVLLCRLANGLRAGCIRRINQMQTPVAYLDNLSLFQSSCREDFGLQEAQLFDIRDLDDLDIRGTLESEEEFRRETDRRLRNILVTLYWLGRVARPLRPDAELDLRTFEALVDPAYFDITSFGEPERSPGTIGEQIEVVSKNSAGRNPLGENVRWESQEFTERKDGRERQVHSASERFDSRELEVAETTTVDNGRHQRLVQHGSSQPINITGTHQRISKFIEHDDDDDDDDDEDEGEAPAPPNWETFPGATAAFDSYDARCLVEAEEGHFFTLHSDVSSSSSSSSFATKEFGVRDPRSPGVIQCLSSPTAALLSASPETLAHDEISNNFERLLRDVEKFSLISKSQSLKHLEDFDEVGFEDQEEMNSDGEVKPRLETNGDSHRKEAETEISARENGIDEEKNQRKTSECKLERRTSDFMDELLTLDEATRKYDTPSSTSPGNYDLSSPSSDRMVTLQSPELLEKPRQRSAKATEVLRQNSFGSSSPSPTGKFRSTYMERFAHDFEHALKFEQPGGSSGKRNTFDLDQERRRMEEWNKRAEEKLKDKFQRDQDLLKEKLKEDLRRAHQVERMKQLQEEKFLEEEVIEVKNRKCFASESSKSKFSKSSLSLFAPLPSKTRGIRSASPDLPPTFTSLTDDWLSQSFSSDVEKPSFDDTLPSADVVSPFGEVRKPEEASGEIDNDDAFEEPAWMKLKMEKVDKISVVDVPVNTAIIEVLPDSLTTSSESLHSASSDRSVDDLRGTAVDGPGFEANVTRSTLDAQPDDSASPLEAPPIPQRDDSLLVTSDILTSREQAAYLTFDASISNFTKSSSSQVPPSSLNLTQSHQQLMASSFVNPAEVLSTPSSDRCSEVCRYVPPSPITPHKRTTGSKDSTSSVFPSPRSPSTDRPDFLFLRAGCDGSEGLPSSSSEPVDYLFAYHDDQLRRRYYWATSPVPSNCVGPVELPSDPKMGSRVNRLEEKASCSGCGYCLATEQTINIYALKSLYHPECFKCKECDAPLSAENVAIYRSVPHCFACFGDLSRH